QWQRHSGALLDSGGGGYRLPDDALPLSAGPVSPRRSRVERCRQCRGKWNGERAYELDERVDDGNTLHRARPGRAFDRPGDRGEDRRRFALPVPADRRCAGVVRREYAAEYELVRL